MKLIKVGAGVLNQTALDWEGNKRNIIACIQEAKEANVSILCLPELAISGYGCEDAFHSPTVHRIAWEVLHEILPATNGIIVAIGLPLFHRHALFNAACLIVDGKIVGFVPKQNLAGDGIHYEPRFFKPWPANVQGVFRRDGEAYPIGDLCFDCSGVKLGFEICEDAWVATRPGSVLASRGVDIILNPSASHFSFEKHSIRKRFVQEGSRAFGVSYVYANLLGNEAGRVIYDGDAMVATLGDIVAEGPRLTFDDHHLTTAVIDVEATRMRQARLTSFKPNLGEMTGQYADAEFDFPVAHPEPRHSALGAWEKSPHTKEEEFTRAVALALYDYMRKSRSRGFVVSLSGGVDSAAVASLCHLMVRMGVDALGLEGFLAKVRYLGFQDIPQEGAVAELTRRLLTCVYQSTRNSGEVTRGAASGVAEALGAEYHELDVDPLVEGYRKMVEGAVERPLTWEQDDIALQNIQARVRSPGVWMLTNIKGALLLSTSNRSEAAVGYATMDGDTSGGLSPIAGIDKDFLRRWLRWLETTGPKGIQPFPVLKLVNDQQPTAELRPQDSKQTDEADLMPYEVLDDIERAAIHDKLSPVELLEHLQLQFPHYTPAQLQAWTRRFFALWCRNQWKRERYAPSFHVDDANLDPKTWCRFPILSGGYARELAELDEASDT